MSYDCHFVEQAAQPTLSIRTRTTGQDLPQLMGKAFGNVAGYLGERGDQPAGPPFAVYYNLDMQNLDVEIGFPVAGPVPGKGDVQTSEIPAGKYAACLYTGAYSDMAPAYEALSQWVRENGYEATGVALEVYLSDPGQVPPPQLQTQILFPLKLKA